MPRPFSPLSTPQKLFMRMKHCKATTTLLLLLGLASIAMSQRANQLVSPKNDVKATFLSIFSGSSRFTYERALSPSTSAEITIGAIGMGYDMMNHAAPEGLVLKGAWKYNLQSAHQGWSPLNGLYLKPEIIYANYRYDNKPKNAPTSKETPRDHTVRWALMAEGGWQYTWRWFLTDIYMGLGPSWGDVNAHNYYHGIMLFPEGGHLAFTAGCRIGIAW